VRTLFLEQIPFKYIITRNSLSPYSFFHIGLSTSLQENLNYPDKWAINPGMANEVKMPQLSDTMHAGKILSWKKKEGDNISRGDILAEVETDKANLEIESFQAGTLLRINIPAGSEAKVGEVIAVIGQPGESVGADSTTKVSPVSNVVSSSQPAHATPQQASPNLQVISPSRSEPKFSNPSGTGEERIRISPLAKKLAEQRNIQLTNVQGSGPNGRIIKKDIDNASSSSASSGATARQINAVPEEHAPISGTASLTPFSKMRDTIARRMQETVRESPHFYVTTSIEMSESKKLREILKLKAEFKGISINHLVIKAAAYAIEHEPRVNNAVKENQLYNPGQINIGIITALDDGLLIPVIKDTNKLSLKDLVFEARSAVERARAGRPNASDLQGGTFSISNMGMFDIDSFTALINPGQGAVLAVSSIKEEPIVKNGQICVGQIMKVTISVDHRIIDGVMAGNFLKFFKEALETPALLLI
jgi:pyruvate dehydrogenase E2 component (dihydrolipoamide acetyltransferase)